MVRDGLMERFGIEEVYGLHNMPGRAAGTFGIRTGGIMAASDKFSISIEGQGGHAAMPHNTVDPVVIAAQLITALQTVVARNVDPMRPAVLSVTTVAAGETFNVIPRTVELGGTVRALDPDVQDLVEARLKSVAAALCARFGASATVDYQRGYPVTVNAPAQTERAAAVAREVVGEAAVDADAAAVMGGEDFSFMLQARPGAYIFLGNGETSALHTDTYDFNDDIIPVGVSYWVRLAESALAQS
jgi:hippurate hydrolase